MQLFLLDTVFDTAQSICVFITQVSPAKRTQPIEISLTETRVAPPGQYDLNDPCSVAMGAVASITACLLYTSPSPRDRQKSRMPSSA